MLDAVTGLGFGFAFGFLLHRAGLTHYERIVNVFLFRDLPVMRFMLAALLAGGVLIEVGLSLGVGELAVAPNTQVVSPLLGGIVFGVGMASAGHCPGTIVAEAGELRLDALLAGVAGLVAGALGFGALHPLITPTLARLGVLGRVKLSELLGASPWLVWLVFGQLWLLGWLLATMPRGQRGRGQETRPGAAS